MEMMYDKDMLEVIKILAQGNDEIAIRNKRILNVLNTPRMFDRVKKFYLKKNKKINMFPSKFESELPIVEEATVAEVTAAVIRLASIAKSIEELDRMLDA